MRFSYSAKKLLAMLTAAAMLMWLIPIQTLAADPPVLIEPRVSSDGNIELSFSTAMAENPGTGGFSVLRYDGVSRTISNAQRMDDPTKIKLTFGGTATIDGVITAATYICVADTIRSEAEYDAIDDGGYRFYAASNGSTVRVGNRVSTLPTVVTGTVTDITRNGAMLSGSVTDMGSSEIIQRGFAYSTDTGPTILDLVIPGSGDDSSFTADLSGHLIPGTTYYVRAFATNASGTAYGAERSFTTLLADPPAAPVNRSYLPLDKAVELHWDDPPDGGSPILRYEICQHNYETRIDVGLNTSYTINRLFNDSELINGVSYTFWIRAVNAAGPGEAGSINCVPNIPHVPSPPQSLNAQAYSGRVDLTWAPPMSNGYRPITYYEASYDEGQTWVRTQFSGSHTFTGLINNQPYTFRVRAVNSIGPGQAAIIQATPRSSGGGYMPTSSPPAPAPSPKAQVLDSDIVINSIPVGYDKTTETAGVVLTDTILDDAFGDTAPEHTADAIAVVFPAITGAKAYAAELPASFMHAEDHSRTIEMNTPLRTVTLPCGMLPQSVPDADQAITLTLKQGNVSALDAELRSQIGDRPVIELSLHRNGQQIIWNHAEVPVTVSIPYTPTAEELENPESIVIWYIDGTGNIVCIPNGHCDPSAGTVIFTITHFSSFAVSFNPMILTDVPNDMWYSKAIRFISARDITAESLTFEFNPEAALTREQFLVMLMKAYSIRPDENPADNFDDAGSGYFSGYAAAAKRLGISAGIGGNRFAPHRIMTRQEMFTLLYNTLKLIKGLLSGNSGITLAHYNDGNTVAPWATKAMAYLVETGIIVGSNGRLDPSGTTTHAQIAQILYRLLTK